ncbi:MAG: hypothetical protein KDB21_01425 [Acidimicrobiales bacterium]|nr:hypothetical protein [Acidimicrobiales bacterium]
MARSNEHVCERTGHVFVFYRANEFEPDSLYRYPHVEDHQLGDVTFWHAADEQCRAIAEGQDSYLRFEAHHRRHSRAWAEYLHQLKVGEADPEFAIVFLEADLWSNGSGYEKQRVMRYVRRATLTPEQRGRLQDVVLAVTAIGPRREFAETRLVAKRIWDGDLERRLDDLAASNPSTRCAVDQLRAKRYTR